MIRLVNVSKAYTSGKQTVRALEEVSISIPTGQIFGLIGYSGAGKSTLLRCINLLERPTAGEVWLDEVALMPLSKRDLQRERRKIGMIFQHFHLLNSKTVAANIAFPLRLAGLPKQARAERVDELLRLVGLESCGDKYPNQLSGGQKQRVAIARALASNPAVLLCDEATSALDPQTTDAILELLLDINRRLGLTIVVVTHEIGVARKLCDHIAVMADGHVLEQGPATDVFLAPRRAVTRQLLSIGEVRDHVGLQAPVASHALGALDVATASEQPRTLSENSASSTTLQIACAGDLARRPVLAEVAAQTGTSYRILKGSVDTLKDVPFARFTVDWAVCGEDGLMAVIAGLDELGCRVEVIARTTHGGATAALPDATAATAAASTPASSQIEEVLA